MSNKSKIFHLHSKETARRCEKSLAVINKFDLLIRIIICQAMIIYCYNVRAENIPKENFNKLPYMTLYHCDVQTIYFSYKNEKFFYKDVSSYKKNLYSEEFDLEVYENNRAIKKMKGYMVKEDFFSYSKKGTILRLEPIEKKNEIMITLDIATGDFFSEINKEDALARIRSHGKCLKE